MNPYDFAANVNRRSALVGLGKAGLIGLVGIPACGSDDAPSDALVSPAGADETLSAVDCVLTPHQAEGPFYLKDSLIRRDITEGREGITLGLDLTIVDAAACAPVAGASVDIWHTDAAGTYSEAGRETFMRGVQVSDGRGQVHFESIYPGWYPGRVPHIHIKIFFENQTSITSQLYFPTEINKTVYALPPYDGRTGAILSESFDPVLGGDSPESLRFTMVGDPEGFTASHTIGIAT